MRDDFWKWFDENSPAVVLAIVIVGALVGMGLFIIGIIKQFLGW